MVATIKVGILGLGRIGASVGLALKRYNARKDARQQFVITGYTADNLESQALKTTNPVDHIARNLIDAASDKDIVVLALPYRDVQAAYSLIGKDLRAGAVLLDTSPLKLPSQEWAEKHLQDEVYMVGVTPILNAKYLFDGLDDPAHAAADLFDGGTLLLLPSPSCDRDAVELASDFGALLGMMPRFGDPVEHDVWSAATEGLPAALGLTAFYSLQRRNGWDDAQRVGNAAFGRLTHHLYDHHPDDLRDLLLNNRDNLVRNIDSTVEALQSLRSLLAENDRAALEEMLIQTMDAYVTWVVHRREGRWDNLDAPAQPSRGELFMNGMFGSALTKRLKRDKSDDDE
ncbi:MAG: prephenate dehydrogenase [Anaerolineae bacterium]|nr:prephenate dehydrogenase [Anaerolineae bacterium]